MAISTPLLYNRVTASLISEVASGYYSDGDRFLSTRFVIRQYHVSQKTAKHALRALVNLGILGARDRSGYYLNANCKMLAQTLISKSRRKMGVPQRTWQDKRFEFWASTKKRESLHAGVIVSGILNLAVSSIEIPAQALKMPMSSRAMMQVAFEAGGAVSFFADDGTEETRNRLRSKLEELRLHGVIAMRRLPSYAPLGPLLEPMVKAGMPVVTLFDDCEHLDVRAIDVNNIGAGRMAVKRLAKKGHRAIGIVLPNYRNSWFESYYVGACLAAKELANLGIVIRKIRLPLNGDLPKEPRGLFFRKNPQRITACLVTATLLMPGLLKFFRRNSLSIPEDVSILLTADVFHATELGRTFDLLRIDFEALGKLAMKSLIQMCRGEPVPRIQLVDLVYRKYGTTAPLLVPRKASI